MIEEVKDICKQAGYSWTKTREHVLRALRGEPITQTELAYRLRAKADRASVYRTIALFEQLGIAHQIWSGSQTVVELTDRFAAHHHHFICENCGRMVDFKDPQLEQVIARLGARHQLRVMHHHLELFGRCARCP